MELILKRISDLPEQSAADLTGEELVIVGNNGVLELVPLSAIYANAQSQLDNVANLSVVTLADIQDQNFTDTYITYPLLAQAIQSLGLLLTPNQQQAFLQHLVNYNNPHRVTAEQVGLGNVSNLPILTESDLEANNYGNKYITYNILQAAAESLGFNDLSNVANYPPTTLSDIQNGVFGETYLTYNLLSQAVQSLNIVLPPLLRTEFLAHLTNYNNPHETTSTQVGLGNVVNLPVLTQADITAGNTSLEAYVTYNLLQAAVNSLPNTGILTASQKTAFLAHLVNYNNPHQVTAAQVGLGNVANLPPIAQSDINNVDNGQTPADVYITYNMLKAANNSLGFVNSSGTTLSLSITGILDDGMTFTANLNGAASFPLANSQLTFTYYPTSNPSNAITTSPIPYSEAVNNVFSVTESSLAASTSYSVYATLIDTSNSSLNIKSSTVSASTLSSSSVSSGGYFFDIVGAGSSDTTELDATSVNGTGGNFTNDTYVASSTGNTAITTPIGDPSADGNFTSCSAQISFKPGSFITPLSGSSTSKVLLSQDDYNTLSSGENIGLVVNGGISNFTIGTNCTLNYTAASSTTTPGTTTTVPAYTVTNPSTTTNYPAVWSLDFNSALAAIPSLLFDNTSRQPVGAISASSYSLTGSNLIASNSTSSTIYLNGPQTFTNGQVVQAIVNGNPVNLTIGSGVTYNSQAAYTTSVTTHPAVYSLSLSSPLANTPTGLYLTSKDPAYSLAPLSVSQETYDSGVITLTLSTFTGNGRYIELGLKNMLAGDTLVELKGNVVQA